MTNKTSSTDPVKWVSAFLLGVAFLVYGGYLIHAIHAERALYADGANFFVELLSKDRYWPIADDSKHIRLFVNFLNQFPVALAVESGASNLRLLKILFGVGLFLTPALIYFYCLLLSRRANDYRIFFLSMVSLVTCAIPSDIFILNQSFTSLALAWVLIHYLLLDLKIKWLDWLVVTSISVILFRSHESLIVWGGLFLVGSASVIIFRDCGNVSNKNLLVYTIGVLGLLQSAFVAFWQSAHPVGEQTRAFLQLLSLLKPSELWIGNTRISLLMALALLFLFAYQGFGSRALVISKKIKPILFIVLAFMAGGMLFTGTSAIYNFDLTNPGREYSYRFLMTFGSGGWMLVAIIVALTNTTLDARVKHLNVIVLSLGMISSSMWQISNNLQWTIFANAGSEVLRTESNPLIDPVKVQQRLLSVEQENAYKYRWGWAWPVFGMSLQRDGRVEKLFRPEGFDDYFQPPSMVPFVGFDGRGVYVFDGFNANKADKQ